MDDHIVGESARQTLPIACGLRVKGDCGCVTENNYKVLLMTELIRSNYKLSIGRETFQSDFQIGGRGEEGRVDTGDFGLGHGGERAGQFGLLVEGQQGRQVAGGGVALFASARMIIANVRVEAGLVLGGEGHPARVVGAAVAPYIRSLR